MVLCGSQPHPDLEVSPEHLLLLQLVLLIFPRLDAQFLLSKEAGKVLVQGHHGLIPQLLIVVLAIHSTLKNRRPVSSLAFCGQMQANTDRSGSPSLAPTAHQRLPCLQHRHQLLPEALVHVSIPILLIALLLVTVLLILRVFVVLAVLTLILWVAGVSHFPLPTACLPTLPCPLLASTSTFSSCFSESSMTTTLSSSSWLFSGFST